jgi:hypothetical protein
LLVNCNFPSIPSKALVMSRGGEKVCR